MNFLYFLKGIVYFVANRIKPTAFYFNVSVSYCMLSTDTPESKLMLGTHVLAIIRPQFKFRHSVLTNNLTYGYINVENLTTKKLMLETFSGNCPREAFLPES